MVVPRYIQRNLLWPTHFTHVPFQLGYTLLLRAFLPVMGLPANRGHVVELPHGALLRASAVRLTPRTDCACLMAWKLENELDDATEYGSHFLRIGGCSCIYV